MTCCWVGLKTARLILLLWTLVVSTHSPARAQAATAVEGAVGAAEVEANPGRPTVSTPATLTPVGYLQFETGTLGAEKSGEFSNRTGNQAALKLSLSRRFELILQTEPMVLSDLGNRNDSEPGEVFAGLQTVVHHGEGSNPTIAVSYIRRLYASPAPELDIGTNRQSGLLLVSFDLRKFHVDTNAIVTEQIDDRGVVHRAQFGQTLSISHPVFHRLALSGE